MPTIPVAAGDDLQAAIDAAVAGDVLELEAGATFTGNFTLPVHAGTSYITIQSAGTLPASGTRVSPATAANFAKIQASAGGQAAITTDASAAYWQIIGVEFPGNPGGFGEIISFGNGDYTVQTTTAQLPHHLILDRCYIHGDTTNGQKRGVGVNCGTVTIQHCYISECFLIGQDSQAICGWNGPGPFTIDNCYLEAAAENVLFGGGSSASVDLMPASLTLTNCLLTKPTAWRSTTYQCKNLLELKMMAGAVIDSNTFENNWANAYSAGQSGFAVLFTVRNEEGLCAWANVTDVQFTRNTITGAGGGISILGADDRGASYPSGTLDSLLIRDNVFTDIAESWGGSARFLQINHGGTNIVVDHNTCLNTQSAGSVTIYLVDGTAPALIVRNNILKHNGLCVFGTNGQAQGTDTLADQAPGYTFTHNVLIAGTSTGYPSGNYYPATEGDVGFTDLAGGDYRLTALSAYYQAGTDGDDIGARLTTAPTPGSAPDAPSTPSPADAATDVATSPTLTWVASGATEYDVAFGTTNPPSTVSSAQGGASYDPGTLLASTTYYWRIVARNSSGTTTGSVWSFTTAAAGGGEVGGIARGTLVVTSYGVDVCRFVDEAGVDVGAPAIPPTCDANTLVYVEGTSTYFGGGDGHTATAGQFYDASFGLGGVLGANLSPFSVSIAQDASGNIYAIQGTIGSYYIRKFGPTGTPVTAYASLGAGNWLVLGVSPDGNTAYYAAANGNVVKRWNLATNAAASDFVTLAGYFLSQPYGITVLPDGSVLVAWGKSGGGGAPKLRLYDATGALLQDFTLADVATSAFSFVHVALAADTSTSPAPSVSTAVWVSYYNASGTGYGVTFAKLRTSDGAVLATFTPADDGFYWDSPFVVVRVAIASGDPLVCTAPDDIASTSADSDTDSAAVTYGTPSASGGTAPYTFSYDTPDGSTFAPGVHTVTCTVTDSVGTTATDTFTVTVTPDVLLQWGGALGFTTDLQNITLNSWTSEAPIIGVGKLPFPNRVVSIFPSLLTPSDGEYPGLKARWYTANNTSSTDVVDRVLQSTRIGTAVAGVNTLYPAPPQVFELVFVISSYDPVAGTLAADGWFEVYLNDTLVLSQYDIVLGQPADRGRWDGCYFFVNGWASSYYVRFVPERVPGYGQQTFSTPAGISYTTATGAFLTDPTYPTPTRFDFPDGTGWADNFADVDAATFWSTGGGHWVATHEFGAGGTDASLTSLGSNVLNGAQPTWALSDQMLVGVQTGGMKNALALPVLPAPTTSACVTAPVQMACWSGDGAGVVPCITDGLAGAAGTWDASFDVTDLAVGLNETGQP